MGFPVKWIRVVAGKQPDFGGQLAHSVAVSVGGGKRMKKRKWLGGILTPGRTSNASADVFRDAPRRVEVQLTEAFGAIKDRQPTMRHRRCFKNVSSEQLLSVLLGLKFYGGGGLMVDSIADSEEDAQDGSSRFIKNFRPLGYSFFRF